MPTKVLFDSSFLIAVAEHPTTWLEDMIEMIGKFEPVILTCVQEELKRTSAREGRKGRYARVAMELAKNFSTVRCGRAGVDEEIVSAALSTKAMVATVDGGLAGTLKAVGVKVVGLRSGRVSLG